MFLKKRLSNTEFKIMCGIYRLTDMVYRYIPARAKSFNLQQGMTVVDYGCGPGRFTKEFARMVGENGKVYAVDLLEIALQKTKNQLQKNGLNNVELRLAQDYDSGIPQSAADMVCAVDMFHHVEPAPFLKEMDRIAKPDGVLLLSGGHMTRKRIKEVVAASGLWKIAEESKRFIKYKKKI